MNDSQKKGRARIVDATLVVGLTEMHEVPSGITGAVTGGGRHGL